MSQPETIAQAVRDRAGDTSTGLIAGDLRLTHAEVVEPSRTAGGLAAGQSESRAVPRGGPARQRARVHLLARGGGAGRSGGGRGEFHPPGRRTATGPRPHRVPVARHRLEFASPRRGPAHRGPPRYGDVGQRPDAGPRYAGRPPHPRPLRRCHGSRRARSLGHTRDPRLSAVHLGNLGGAQGLLVQPGPDGPHR